MGGKQKKSSKKSTTNNNNQKKTTSHTQQHKPQQRQQPSSQKPSAADPMAAVKRAMSRVSDLGVAMAMPSVVRDVRFPTMDMPRSYAVTFRDQMTLTSNDGVGPGDFPAKTTAVAFYGQAGRLARIWRTRIPRTLRLLFAIDTITARNPVNVSTSVTNVSQMNVYSQTFNGLPVFLVSKDNTHLQLMEGFWPLVGGIIQDVRGTSTQSIGVSKTANFVFLSKGDTIEVDPFDWVQSNVNGKFDVLIYRWQDTSDPKIVGAQQVLFIGGKNTSTTVLFTADDAGEYAVFLEESEVTQGLSVGPGQDLLLYVPVMVQIAKNQAIGWDQVHMQDLDFTNQGDISMGNHCRVNASSVLISNTTAAINRDGTVLAARLRQSDLFRLDDHRLMRAAEKYTGLAANGCYTFHEYTAEREKFRESISSIGHLLYHLDEVDYVHLVAISTQQASTFLMTFDTTIEFVTDVARYPQKTSSYSYSELVEARRMINSNPIWFYENPLHAADIYNFLKRSMRGVRDLVKHYGPTAANVASAIDPAGIAAYQAVGQLLKRM